MFYTAHVPPVGLRPFVAGAVGYRVPANPTGVHRGLPSRHVTLVVELSAPLRVRGGRNTVAAHAMVGGLHTGPALIDASTPQEGLQYALTPPAASMLCGVPAGELSGLVVDLHDIVGPTAGELVERIAETPSWAQRFRLVDHLLLHRLDAAVVAPEVTEAWRLIFVSGGRLPIAAVADRVGWSRRHLSERLRHATGVTPKQAARIARFELAHRMLANPNRSPLAQVAADCGYADQAHLAREWKSFAGCTIATWLRDEFPFVQDTAAGPEASSAA